MSVQPTFDAIVVGSGITGGLAAKELAERGLKVLMLERGKNVEHRRDYKTEFKAPWDLPFRGEGDARRLEERYPVQKLSGHVDEWNQDFWVDDIDQPYQSVNAPGFRWIRGYQLGGRSLTWGRQCYRWSDTDFSANSRDGYGTDWPIRYADLAPWYDHVETFAGVSGQAEGLPQLPDGRFQPGMPLNIVEAHVRKKIAERFPERRLTIGRIANLTEAQPELGRPASTAASARAVAPSAPISARRAPPCRRRRPPAT
jgi:choline dehydrogenase-like flavoprotein